MSPLLSQAGLILQIAELGGENERLQLQLTDAQQKQKQAESTVQQLQQHQPESAAPTANAQAQSNVLHHQLEDLRRHNTELQTELAAVKQSLKAEESQAAQQRLDLKQHRDSSEHASWELQHRVDTLTQENQSLLAHHAQLESRFEGLTKQLAKAQHAQHAGAQSKAEQAESFARAHALQEQVNNLMEGSAAQVEQRHRLENEVASLQRKLTNAESALDLHQHRVRGHKEAETASSGRIAELQQQAESVVQENAALQAQCRRQTADMKQLQTDVQVGMHTGISHEIYGLWAQRLNMG